MVSMSPTHANGIFRFGVYEADPESGEQRAKLVHDLPVHRRGGVQIDADLSGVRHGWVTVYCI